MFSSACKRHTCQGRRPGLAARVDVINLRQDPFLSLIFAQKKGSQNKGMIQLMTGPSR